VSPEERAEQVRHARQRLAALRSVALGLDNPRAVSDTLMASENRAGALIALQELLGVDETGARAIAELQWVRLTRDTRPHVAQEIGELEAEIRGLEG
jgi:DNA gyrase/topoisomerase IV subunit A